MGSSYDLQENYSFQSKEKRKCSSAEARRHLINGKRWEDPTRKVALLSTLVYSSRALLRVLWTRDPMKRTWQLLCQVKPQSIFDVFHGYQGKVKNKT